MRWQKSGSGTKQKTKWKRKKKKKKKRSEIEGLQRASLKTCTELRNEFENFQFQPSSSPAPLIPTRFGSKKTLPAIFCSPLSPLLLQFHNFCAFFRRVHTRLRAFLRDFYGWQNKPLPLLPRSEYIERIKRARESLYVHIRYCRPRSLFDCSLAATTETSNGQQSEDV